jgi:hypothetical protein
MKYCLLFHDPLGILSKVKPSDELGEAMLAELPEIQLDVEFSVGSIGQFVDDFASLSKKYDHVPICILDSSLLAGPANMSIWTIGRGTISQSYLRNLVDAVIPDGEPEEVVEDVVRSVLNRFTQKRKQS